MPDWFGYLASLQGGVVRSLATELQQAESILLHWRSRLVLCTR